MVSKKLLGEVANYIKEHYIGQHKSYCSKAVKADRGALDEVEYIQYNVSIPLERKSMVEAPVEDLEDLVGNLDEPFATTLLRLIDST
ncbi:MAG TPA: hypothetical protein GXZ21_01585 [Clostridiales bacterium]|nr:hypothetical protein [Clostridiales bacterium]